MRKNKKHKNNKKKKYKSICGLVNPYSRTAYESMIVPAKTR